MSDPDSDERRLRLELAAALRLAARFAWQEAVANHLSVATSSDGGCFLINPRWRHFASLRASELLLLDARSQDGGGEHVDPTAWAIHASMHAHLPQARCIMHLHPPYATAVSCLADCDIKPIDQTSARFFRRVAIDSGYGGMADNVQEGLRLTRALGRRQVLMMGNHGALVVGDSVAEAYDALYHLERACRTLLLAYASGRPLATLSDEIAEKTARAWEDGGAAARAHFAQLRELLDAEEPSYAL
jgi:ribulose-5-phosphate 4-epimerase/fuculose-1-phosphate aldolase